MPLPRDNLFYGLGKMMTDEQRVYVDSIIDNSVTICNAQAGTGKTTLAIAAMKYLAEKKIVCNVNYIFATVEEDKLGWRPGNTEEKESDYIDPLYDALIEINEQPERSLDEKFGWITAKSHNFLRGTNIRNTGIVIEESQNFTKEQLRKTISRIHDDCKVVIIGHTGQKDISKSGFEDVIDHANIEPERIKICTLTKNFRGWISMWADSI